MNRRELLKMISAATGYALIGSPVLMSACSRASEYSGSAFSGADVGLLAEIAETIIPRTSTPGASDAEVAPFIAMMVEDCYSNADQAAFHEGLVAFNHDCSSTYKTQFASLSPELKTEFLTDLDIQARDYQRAEGGSAHYFTMIKQLTLLGFFTSEIAQKEVLRLVPIPGSFDGCYPLQKGEAAWAI
jgi:hypothetical protein